MIATNRFRTVLTVALTCALVGGSVIADASSRPQIRSFVGVCNLSGTQSRHGGFLFDTGETIALSGNCTGRVNGDGALSTWKARMETTGTLSLIQISGQGSGFLKLRGVRGSLSFDYRRVSDRAIEILGNRSRAWGAVRESDGVYRLAVATAGEFRGR